MKQNKGIVEGRVVAVIPETTKAGKEKLTVVIDTAEPGGKWPNPVPVCAFGKSVGYIAGLQVGDEARVAVYLRGREWQGRYFAENAPADKAEVTSAQPLRPAPDAVAADMAVPEDEALPF
jgi:hypothetical protein